MSERSRQQRKGIKKTMDADDARRKRGENTIGIRKAKREANLQKRRDMRRSNNANQKRINDPNAFDTTSGEQIIYRRQDLPGLAAAVRGNDEKRALEATVQFRKILSIERSPPIQEVIQTGVVKRFIQFLGVTKNPMLQFEAAWALTNVASGNSAQTRVVIDEGAVPIFVRLLQSEHDDVREQAVWALGNIAGDSPSCRDLVLSAGAMTPLLKCLQETQRLTMLRNATWTLSNFCRGKPAPDFKMVLPCLKTLSRLLYSTDDEVLTDACWALSYLSDGPNERIQAVIEAGVCRRLVELLMHPSFCVQTPALRTVGNIVTGDDLQTQIIINVAALPCLFALLQSPKNGIKKEACWTISNITAGNRAQIQRVIDSNLIRPLVKLLGDSQFDIKKEAAWAISNATSGGSENQIRYIAAQGVFKPLCDLLDAHDVRIVSVALEALENILKIGQKDALKNPNKVNPYSQAIDACDGITNIEALQHHNNNEIYEKVSHILETYFEMEEDDDQNIAPQTNGGLYAFQPMNGGGINL